MERKGDRDVSSGMIKSEAHDFVQTLSHRRMLFLLLLILTPVIVQLFINYCNFLSISAELNNFSGNYRTLFFLAQLAYNLTLVSAFIIPYFLTRIIKTGLPIWLIVFLVSLSSLIGNYLGVLFFSEFTLPHIVGGYLGTSIFFGWVGTSLIMMGGFLLPGVRR